MTIRFITDDSNPLITDEFSYLITDEIAADLVVISSLTADLTVAPGFKTNLTVNPSLTAELSTSINGSATLAVESSMTALLGSIVEVEADLSAQSSLTADLTTGINLSASLAASASLTAELNTEITALAALISVTNLLDATLTVTRINPVWPVRAGTIFLAEVEAYDPATDSVITWRYSSGKGYDNAGVFYQPRIENPATLSRSMGGASVGGKASTSYGELTLINNDQALNALGDTFVDGRTLTIKRGSASATYDTFATVLVATMESAAIERERISIRLRDKSVTLDEPFSSVKYAGDNILPYGIEGTTDIKDQPKPRVFGRIALMQPVLVNTSKLIYQVNAGAVDSVVNVFDAGAYLSRSSDYSSQYDMETNAPAEGSFRVWPAGGCFRLGSSAYGQLGVCVAEKWDYTQNSAAGIIQRILAEKGYTSSDWVAADFTALNQKNVAPLGLLVSGEESTASLLDRICQSVGAWWGFDAIGRFRVARFDAPTGTAAATLTDYDILELERQPEEMLPVWQTTLKADINYVVQAQDSLAGIVSAPRSAWLALESRDQKAEDSAVKTQRLLAEQQTWDSVLNGISQAKAESDRRLALFSTRRDSVNVTVANPQDYDLDLGDVVELQTAKLGYDSGKLFTITGVSVDYAANQLDLTLWG